MSNTSAHPHFLEEEMAWGTDLHSLRDGCEPFVQESGRWMKGERRSGDCCPKGSRPEKELSSRVDKMTRQPVLLAAWHCSPAKFHVV